MEKSRQSPAPADHLANERTFLAWIRTSIALMGFGFVIVKFALFLRQLSLMATDKGIVLPEGNSSVVGVTMVSLGAVVAILAYVRYRNIEQQLRENNYAPSGWLAMMVTVGIVAGSILMALYLVPRL